MSYVIKFYTHIHVPTADLVWLLKENFLKKRIARNIELFLKSKTENDPCEHFIMIVETLYSKRQKVIDYVEKIQKSFTVFNSLRVIELEDRKV